MDRKITIQNELRDHISRLMFKMIQDGDRIDYRSFISRLEDTVNGTMDIIDNIDKYKDERMPF